MVAANNILKLIKHQEGGAAEEPLEEYTPGPPGIKVSVGLVRRYHTQDQISFTLLTNVWYADNARRLARCTSVMVSSDRCLTSQWTGRLHTCGGSLVRPMSGRKRCASKLAISGVSISTIFNTASREG